MYYNLLKKSWTTNLKHLYNYENSNSPAPSQNVSYGILTKPLELHIIHYTFSTITSYRSVFDKPTPFTCNTLYLFLQDIIGGISDIIHYT